VRLAGRFGACDPLLVGENLLQQSPIDRDQIGDDADQGDQNPHAGQQRAQDHRLDVTRALPDSQQVEIAEAQQEPGRQRDRADGDEEAQRPIGRKCAHDRSTRTQDVVGHALHEARRSQVRIGADRHRGHRHVLRTGGDDGLQGIGVLAMHMQVLRRLAREGAKAARRVDHRGRRRHAHHQASEQLQRLLGLREVRRLHDRPGADHQIGLAGQDRPRQLGNVLGAILIVGVGVDDHVGAGAHRSLEAGGEGPCQALVVLETDDVIDTVGERYRHRIVAAAVIDHHPFDARKALDLARQGRQRDAQGLRLVETGNLDDQSLARGHR
jgi:hypothetical protein